AHLHAGAHAPDRVGIRLPVRLHRREPGQLGRTVYLLEVDAEGAKEPIGIDAEWRTAGIGPARATQTELIAHRPVDEDFAQREAEPGRERDRLAVVTGELRALGEIAEELEQAALERRSVGGAELDRAEQVFPDARRRQEGGGAELAQITLHGLDVFRAIAGEA